MSHATTVPHAKNNEKYLWENASEQDISNYKQLLDDCLSGISVPWEAIQCDDFFL